MNGTILLQLLAASLTTTAALAAPAGNSTVVGALASRIASPISGTTCEHTRTEFRCVKFLHNYDADTISVDIPNVPPLIGEKVSVRVNGIDAPEMKGKTPCEKDAARTAQRLVAHLLRDAKEIHLKNVERDKYFRILADVEVDGKMLRDLLLKNQLAYEYHGGTKAAVDWCRFTKRQATEKVNP